MQHSTRHCIFVLDEALVGDHHLAGALLKEAWTVHIYTNAYDMLNPVRSSADLFVIDINAPGINGLELCRWLKDQEESRSTPVLLLSSTPELAVLAEDSPADGILSPPFTTERLWEKVNDILVAAREKAV
jgi:DNA-binding response OmpR family regulator